MEAPARIAYCAPSPLDAPVAVRTNKESSALLAGVRTSNRFISLSGIVPASVDNIRLAGLRSRLSVLHLAAHAGATDVELEDGRGSAVHIGPRTLAKALVDTAAAVIVLNGCETERIARLIPGAVTSHVICTTAFLPDETAVRFVELFYPLLLETGDVGRSYRAACDLLREDSEQVPYYHFASEEVLQPVPGALTVEQSFLHARARADVQATAGRHRDLLELHPFMTGADSPLLWVTGPPLAGVSTFLRAAATYYAYMFEEQPIHLDLRSVTPLGVRDRDEPVQDPTVELVSSLKEALAARSILVCIDHFDNADPTVAENVLNEVHQLSPSSSSRVLIGSGPIGNTAPRRRTLELGELSKEEAFLLLSEELGPDRAERARPLLREMPRLPGRLKTIISDIKNGAADEHILDLIRSGDIRSDLGRLVIRLAQDDAVRLLVRCLLEAGPRAPRSAIQASFIAVSSEGHLSEHVDVNAVFELAVASLREVGMIWIKEVQPVAGSLPEAYFFSTPDFLYVSKKQVGLGAPSERLDCVKALSDIALMRAREGLLSVEIDAQWVGRTARACRDLALNSRAAELGHSLLHKDGIFRMAGPSSEIHVLARASFDAAREIGELDTACQLGLVMGEVFYKSGRIDEAADLFRQCLALNSSPGRNLQALRALGQTSYRRGQYDEALQLYEQAEEFANDSPPDSVATLRHQRSKALFRLKRYSEAADGLREVIEYRRTRGDLRSMIKAEHELARLLQEQGLLEEAERLFQLVLSGAETEGFQKLIPAPLYQLALLELRRGNSVRARDYQVRCATMADALDDPFWQVLARLANGMIEFELGHFGRASQLITEAIEAARKFGFPQIIDDVRLWIRSQALPAERMGADDAEAAMAPLLSRLEGLDERKMAKALRYSREPERITAVEIRFSSDSDKRTISWMDGAWTCTCDLFQDEGSCSHLVALSLLGSTPWDWTGKINRLEP